MSILLHQMTGRVLTRAGVKKLLAGLDMLEDQMTLEQLGQPRKWKEGIVVQDVQCVNGETIKVLVDRHGVATIR